MPQEPLSANEVIEVCQALWEQNDFREWRSINDNRDGIRFRRPTSPVDIPGIPEKLEDKRSVLEHQVERFNNYMDGANLKLRATAKDDSDAAKQAAQRVENGGYAIIGEFSSVRSNTVYAAHRRAIDQTTAKGCGVRHLEFAPHWSSMLSGGKFKDLAKMLSALKIEDGFTQNPYVITCPSLGAVGFEPDQSMVCELGEKKLSSLQSIGNKEVSDYLGKHPEGLTSETEEENTRSEPTAKTYHLETPNYIYEVIDVSGGNNGFLVSYRPNPTGRPWYSFTPGNLTESRLVYEAFQPLVGPIYSEVQKLSIYGTLLASAALQTGRIGYQEVAIGANAISAIDFLTMPQEQLKTIEFSFIDSPRQPRDGYEWKPIPVPDQAILLTESERTEQRIQAMGFPPVLDPSAALKAESGYDRNQMGEAASLYLDPPLRNQAAGVKGILELIRDISLELPVSLTLNVVDRASGGTLRAKRKETIKPEDWEGVDFQVSYESVPLGAQSVIQTMHERRVEAGHESRQTLMENMYDDPQEEENRINSDRVHAIAAAKVDEDVKQLIDIQAPAIKEQVLAEEGVPLSEQELIESLGLQDPRMQRPAGNNSQPGLGAPAVPPVQSQNGQPQAGFETQVQV